MCIYNKQYIIQILKLEISWYITSILGAMNYNNVSKVTIVNGYITKCIKLFYF